MTETTSPTPPGSKVSLDLIALALITLFAIVAHFYYWRHAGGLWRDEVNSVAMAEAGFSQTWENLRYDTFPLAHAVFLKIWRTIGLGSSDAGLRFSGLLIGIALLASVFAAGRMLGVKAPVLAIALVGLNPIIIRYGDSLRPYGMGTALGVLCLGLLWRMIQRPTIFNTALAALACVLCAQTSYQSTTAVLGCCTAAAAVAGFRKQWASVVRALGAGALAALCLVPYIGRFQATQDWLPLLKLPKGQNIVFPPLTQTFSSHLSGAGLLWVFLGAAALAACTYLLIQSFWRLNKRNEPFSERFWLSIYCIGAMLITAPVMVALLANGGMNCQPWHALPLLPLAAVSVEAIVVASVGAGAAITAARTTLAAAFAIMVAPHAFEQLTPAQTNVNFVADVLNEKALKGDLILVTPWYMGVPFSRYYHGQADWTTIPQLSDHTIHRYDLIKAAMVQSTKSSPIDDVLTRVSTTLSSGGRVWIVGDIINIPIEQLPPRLPVPLHNDVGGWFFTPYTASWESQTVRLIGSYSPTVQAVEVKQPPVRPEENLSLRIVAARSPR